MTTTQLQLRRDTTTNIDGITPAQGEPIYDVTRKALVLGDGATAGGLCVTPIGPLPWTPVILGSTTNPTVTYAVQAGWYVQIGSLVIAQGAIALSAISGGSGSVIIGGLPISAVTGVNTNGACVISSLGGLTFHSSSYTQAFLNISNTGGIVFQEAGSGVAAFQSTVSQLGSIFEIEFIAIYQAAQPTG